MAKAELKVIGTARRPNASDLRERGITGLVLDPGPEIALRRAEFESQQAAWMGWTEGGFTLSFERTTKIGSREKSGDETGSSDRERDVLSERCDDEVKVDEKGSKGGKRRGSLTGRNDLLQSLVTDDETGAVRKNGRVLRDRSPLQLQPYAREREAYRKMVKGGKVEA